MLFLFVQWLRWNWLGLHSRLGSRMDPKCSHWRQEAHFSFSNGRKACQTATYLVQLVGKILQNGCFHWASKSFWSRISGPFLLPPLGECSFDLIHVGQLHFYLVRKKNTKIKILFHHKKLQNYLKYLFFINIYIDTGTDTDILKVCKEGGLQGPLNHSGPLKVLWQLKKLAWSSYRPSI